MYLAAGTFREAPQRTHRWNYRTLSCGEAMALDPSFCATSMGDQAAVRRYRFGFPVFHMPVLGGWRHYAVVAPELLHENWHVGWVTEDANGVSRIPLTTPARLLIGPEPVRFFGVRVSDNRQLPVKILAIDAIGTQGPYSKYLLL